MVNVDMVRKALWLTLRTKRVGSNLLARFEVRARGATREMTIVHYYDLRRATIHARQRAITNNLQLAREEV